MPQSGHLHEHILSNCCIRMGALIYGWIEDVCGVVLEWVL